MNNNVVLFTFNPTTGMWILKEINQGVLSTYNISSGLLPPNISFYDFVDPHFWVPLNLIAFLNNTQATTATSVVDLQTGNYNVVGIVLGVVFGFFFAIALLVIAAFLFFRRTRAKKHEQVELESQNNILLNDIKREQEIKILTTKIHIWKGTWRHQEW